LLSVLATFKTDLLPTPSEFEKHLFMTFFEELAVMINSNLIGDNFAAYNIGIDAVRFHKFEKKYHDDSY
jgi:hypothetical protein